MTGRGFSTENYPMKIWRNRKMQWSALGMGLVFVIVWVGHCTVISPKYLRNYQRQAPHRAWTYREWQDNVQWPFVPWGETMKPLWRVKRADSAPHPPNYWVVRKKHWSLDSEHASEVAADKRAESLNAEVRTRNALARTYHVRAFCIGVPASFAIGWVTPLCLGFTLVGLRFALVGLNNLARLLFGRFWSLWFLDCLIGVVVAVFLLAVPIIFRIFSDSMDMFLVSTIPWVAWAVIRPISARGLIVHQRFALIALLVGAFVLWCVMFGEELRSRNPSWDSRPGPIWLAIPAVSAVAVYLSLKWKHVKSGNTDGQRTPNEDKP